MKKQRHLSNKNLIYWFENEIIKTCHFSKSRFHKLRNQQWKSIYQKITETFADKTKTWKNGLHWANINGYSSKSMKYLLGCYPVDYAIWFYHLPQIIPNDAMVYFLIDRGGDWHTGEHVWLFESYLPELIKALTLLNKTTFLDFGFLDYYIISKKFKWIISLNHHNIVSIAGKDCISDCLLSHKTNNN